MRFHAENVIFEPYFLFFLTNLYVKQRIITPISGFVASPP